MGLNNSLGKAKLGGLITGADLSAVTNRGRFVKLSGATVVLCGVGGKGAIGILEDGGTASGQAATITPLDGRIAEVRAGATLSAGAAITSDANGKAKALIDSFTKTDDAGVAVDPLLGSVHLGYVLADCVDGDLVTAYLYNSGANPTTST